MVSLQERVTKSGYSVNASSDVPGIHKWQSRYKDLCYAWLKKARVRYSPSIDGPPGMGRFMRHLLARQTTTPLLP